MRNTIKIAIIVLSLSLSFVNVNITLAAPAVESFSANIVSSAQIDLSWTLSGDSVNADHYNLINTTNGLIYTGTDTSYSDIGLNEFTYYSYELVACADAEESDCTSFYVDAEETPDSKMITSFVFEAISVAGTVNNNPDDYTVDLIVPFETDVTDLTPTINISVDATISPLSGSSQDFTNPVIYTVTSADTSTRDYTVTVTVNPDPDIALVAADKAALVADLIKGSNPDLSNIAVALTNPLPSSGDNGTTITWTPSNTGVVSNDGQTINRPSYASGNAAVTMIATLTKGVVTDTKDFNLTILRLPASTVATVYSLTYTVSADGTSSETIINVPFNTAKATFLAALIKGEVNQTWNDTNIADPIVSGNTLVVTAQDGVTVATYAVTVAVADDHIATAFSAISDTLTSAGIYNNLNTITGLNYTSFSGLFFEKRTNVADEATAIGRITFSSALDLSDSETRTFLQYLETKMTNASGKIGLDLTGATDSLALKGINATLKFYSLDDLGFDAVSTAAEIYSKLAVFDDSGNPLEKSALVPPEGVYDGGTYVYTVEVEHFTEYNIDTTSPVISNVSSTTANDSYKADQIISINIVFNENVNVTGTPQLTMETGTTDRVASYASGAGTSTLIFNYTVQTGDISNDLDYVAINSLAQNGGTIKDAVGNDAVLTLPAVGTFAGVHAIAIDTIAPSSVTLATSNPTTSAITLTWTAPGDDASIGTATSYDIRYSTSTITAENWATATIVSDEPSPQISGTSQSKIVSDLSASTTYYFALKTTDEAGNISILSNIPTGTTSSAGGGGGGGGGSPTTSSVSNMSISINAGAVTTNKVSVNLTIGATNATRMAISNSSDFATGMWEAYVTAKSWNLTTGDGTKTVYIKFQDSSGYHSAAISDSITMSVSAVPDTSYPNGTLLKSVSDEKVYVIIDGQKKWIETAADFASGGYKWEDIKTATSAEIEATPDYGANGNVVPSPTPDPVPSIGKYPDGTLIKISDSFRVYVILNQKKKWISTPEVFETLGYKWGNISIISKSELDAISDYEDNLIRAVGDYKVYLVVNGIKHHIPNPEIFLDYGFGWSDVKDVPANTVEKYRSAKLIRESKQGKIYYLSSGEVKKWIPTAEIFDSYGNKWEDVQVISKKEMASYAVSNLMRYGEKVYLISGTYKKLIPSDAIFTNNKFNSALILDANKVEYDWYKNGRNVK